MILMIVLLSFMRLFIIFCCPSGFEKSAKFVEEVRNFSRSSPSGVSVGASYKDGVNRLFVVVFMQSSFGLKSGK